MIGKFLEDDEENKTPETVKIEEENPFENIEPENIPVAVDSLNPAIMQTETGDFADAEIPIEPPPDIEAETETLIQTQPEIQSETESQIETTPEIKFETETRTEIQSETINPYRREIIGDESEKQQDEPFIFQNASQPAYKPESAGETIRKSGLAYAAGITLFASIVFMLILGWFADLLLGSSPYGVVGGVVLGAIIGFVQFFRITSQIFKNKN